MPLMTRVGFSRNLICNLSGGYHLKIDYSDSERLYYGKLTQTKTRDNVECVYFGVHSLETFYDTETLDSVMRLETVAAVVDRLVPDAELGIQADGSYPVIAYTKYSKDELRIWSYLALDLPADTDSESNFSNLPVHHRKLHRDAFGRRTVEERSSEDQT